MAFCVKCGKELPDSAKFCTSCGAPVNKKQTPGKEEQLAEEKERTVPVQESEQDAPAAQTAEETGGAPLEEPMEAPNQVPNR